MEQIRTKKKSTMEKQHILRKYIAFFTQEQNVKNVAITKTKEQTENNIMENNSLE